MLEAAYIFVAIALVVFLVYLILIKNDINTKANQ